MKTTKTIEVGFISCVKKSNKRSKGVVYDPQIEPIKEAKYFRIKEWENTIYTIIMCQQLKNYSLYISIFRQLISTLDYGLGSNDSDSIRLRLYSFERPTLVSKKLKF